ncbi:restriction endonuclease subunit S [Enterococcus cecorum]|uniref:restriction endonuclease subunit S n=1 Tax=Enterococcus cecorum TaxID=44008 RepID=UPI0009B97570|nr:restriction endonuclease subunit S [Enterococcus cecorum]CAI3303497.1 restriction endonuclease subunit S [Enterococcus cecorum]CAI3341014.1 restriction endonuclease subunit S [Enterococcus cecorum]CAI3341224.1 restriction endonuclease subunit S [Enterococcus cecorum]CAI3385248.1 restriction endonuclease subunit S [Enterococcus cecorum]CAI3386700.1 restriction endonuclease subunit S [Enterococcus cecorum]
MKENYSKLGKYITLVDERNRELAITKLLGVSITKKFIPSIANTIGTDFSKYKIVRKGQFAYGPVTSRNGEKISIALLEEEDCIISSSYSVFEVIDKEILNPEYLMLWFSRPEFDRYARYHSHGSVRESFDWNEMCQVELPIPSIDIQNKIVNAYRMISERIALKQKINDNLVNQALALFSDFVSQLSKELEQRKLSDVIASANTGGDAIQKVPIVDYDTGIKCARVGDITNTREYASWAFCNASKSVYDNYKLQAGDILVTRTATLGITQYIPKDISAVYNNGLIRLKVNDTNALPLYIYWAMKTSNFLNYINQMNSATSVRPNMKIDYLLNYQLSIPSIEEQTQFVNAVEPLMNAISLNNDELLKLSEFQAIILTTLSSR